VIQIFGMNRFKFRKSFNSELSQKKMIKMFFFFSFSGKRIFFFTKQLALNIGKKMEKKKKINKRIQINLIYILLVDIKKGYFFGNRTKIGKKK